MKAEKVRRLLHDSLRAKRIITADRDAYELSMTDGFVIAMTDDWVVLHALEDGVYLDDVVMLRLQDISRVSFRDDDAYHDRAIAALDGQIADFSCNDSAGPSELLQEASTEADIFAIRLEVLDGEPLAIDRLLRTRKNSFDMHYVSRNGVWADDIERWKYRDLTRIEVGGRYLSALNRFAEPYPVADKA
jgi:hypothetical protein